MRMNIFAGEPFKLPIAAVLGFGKGQTKAPGCGTPSKRFGTDDIQRPGIAADPARPTVIGERRRSEGDDRGTE